MSYTRSGEVLAECGAAYTKAYKLYRAAGDDKWVAKTVSRLAQAYLERLVSPVLLLHLPIERLTQLTAAPVPGRLTQLTLEEVEKVLVQKALARAGGNVTEAARALGLSRSAMYRRLERYGL